MLFIMREFLCSKHSKIRSSNCSQPLLHIGEVQPIRNRTDGAICIQTIVSTHVALSCSIEAAHPVQNDGLSTKQMPGVVCLPRKREQRTSEYAFITGVSTACVMFSRTAVTSCAPIAHTSIFLLPTLVPYAPLTSCTSTV